MLKLSQAILDSMLGAVCISIELDELLNMSPYGPDYTNPALVDPKAQLEFLRPRLCNLKPATGATAAGGREVLRRFGAQSLRALAPQVSRVQGFRVYGLGFRVQGLGKYEYPLIVVVPFVMIIVQTPKLGYSRLGNSGFTVRNVGLIP